MNPAIARVCAAPMHFRPVLNVMVVDEHLQPDLTTVPDTRHNAGDHTHAGRSFVRVMEKYDRQAEHILLARHRRRDWRRNSSRRCCHRRGRCSACHHRRCRLFRGGCHRNAGEHTIFRATAHKVAELCLSRFDGVGSSFSQLAPGDGDRIGKFTMVHVTGNVEERTIASRADDRDIGSRIIEHHASEARALSWRAGWLCAVRRICAQGVPVVWRREYRVAFHKIRCPLRVGLHRLRDVNHVSQKAIGDFADVMQWVQQCNSPFRFRR